MFAFFSRTKVIIEVDLSGVQHSKRLNTLNVATSRLKRTQSFSSPDFWKFVFNLNANLIIQHQLNLATNFQVSLSYFSINVSKWLLKCRKPFENIFPSTCDVTSFPIIQTKNFICLQVKTKQCENFYKHCFIFLADSYALRRNLMKILSVDNTPGESSCKTLFLVFTKKLLIDFTNSVSAPNKSNWENILNDWEGQQRFQN